MGVGVRLAVVAAGHEQQPERCGCGIMASAQVGQLALDPLMSQ